MLLRQYSGGPTDHVMKYVRGRMVEEGRGLSFVYAPRITRVVSVPGHSIDARFKFPARTSDLLPVELEGDITFRITEPALAASALDFTVQPGRGNRDAISTVKRRLLSVARDLMRDEMKRIGTRDALVVSESLGRSTRIRMSHSRFVRAMGVTVMNVAVSTVCVPEEMTRAIEEDSMERVLLEPNRMASGDSLLMTAYGRGQVTPQRHRDGPARRMRSVECTESCPFRGVCRDFMANLVDGIPRCTLFREFST
jgi:hypothetical protein